MTVETRQPADRAPVWHRMDDTDNPPPKDGTAILAYCPSLKSWIVVRAKWEEFYTPPKLFWVEPYEGQDVPPLTHWCYPPAPPATEPASPKETP